MCDSLLGPLLNIPRKTKDGIETRLNLIEIGVRKELAPKVGKKWIYLPPVCFMLTKDEKCVLNQCLFDSKVPNGYSSNIRALLDIKELKLVGLKSHDFHTLMQHLLPIAIRSILLKNVWYTITRLCLFFNTLCCKVIDISKLDQLQNKIVEVCVWLTNYFQQYFLI